MPALSLGRWKAYLPNLADNLKQEKPFALELRCEMSKRALTDWRMRWGTARARKQEADPEAIQSLVAEVARMGPEPLTVDGRTIATLSEYVELCLDMAGEPLLEELAGALEVHNSVLGANADFFARLSGGSFTTPTAPGAQARDDGSEISGRVSSATR